MLTNKMASAFAVAVLLLSIVACGHSSTLPTPIGPDFSTLHQVLPSSVSPARTGRAMYTGHYKFLSITCGTGTANELSFKARGTSTWVGNSLANGFVKDCKSSASWSGPITFSSKANPANAIHAKLNFSTAFSICAAETGTWTVTRGTGTFRGAKGGGNVQFHCNASTGSYTANYDGEVTY
jgi:hypothetical protein